MRRRLAFLGLLLALTTTGCYQPFAARGFLVQRAVDARELYREAAITREVLVEERVACLPTRVSFGQETLGRAVERGLWEALHACEGCGGVVHPNEVAGLVNASGLTRSFGDLLTTYDQTGILERDMLRAISEVTAARYFALPIVVDYRESSSTRFSAFGVRMGKTASASSRFQLQIWDSRTGRIVWEGISELTLAEEVLRERPVRMDEIIRATWDSLLERLPTTASGRKRPSTSPPAH